MEQYVLGLEFQVDIYFVANSERLNKNVQKESWTPLRLFKKKEQLPGINKSSLQRIAAIIL